MLRRPGRGLQLRGCRGIEPVGSSSHSSPVLVAPVPIFSAPSASPRLFLSSCIRHWQAAACQCHPNNSPALGLLRDLRGLRGFSSPSRTHHWQAAACQCHPQLLCQFAALRLFVNFAVTTPHPDWLPPFPGARVSPILIAFRVGCPTAADSSAAAPRSEYGAAILRQVQC